MRLGAGLGLLLRGQRAVAGRRPLPAGAARRGGDGAQHGDPRRGLPRTDRSPATSAVATAGRSRSSRRRPDPAARRLRASGSATHRAAGRSAGAQGADEAASRPRTRRPGGPRAGGSPRSVRTLVRLWASLPFLVGSGLVVARRCRSCSTTSSTSSTSQRGLVAASAARRGARRAGPARRRCMTGCPSARRPAWSRSAACSAAAPRRLIVVMAVSPWLWLTIAALVGIGVVTAPLVADRAGARSRSTVPARARGFALSFGSLFVALGLLGQPVHRRPRSGPTARAGGIAVDRAGLPRRRARSWRAPGASVDADIRAATAAAHGRARSSREPRASGQAKLLVVPRRRRRLRAGAGAVRRRLRGRARARSSRCSAPTAPASRRCCRAICGHRRRRRNGAIIFDGERHHPPAADEHVAPRASCRCPAARACSRRSPSPRTCELAGWLYRDDDEHVDGRDRAGARALPASCASGCDEPAGNLSGGEQQMLALGAGVPRPSRSC